MEDYQAFASTNMQLGDPPVTCGRQGGRHRGSTGGCVYFRPARTFRGSCFLASDLASIRGVHLASIDIFKSVRGECSSMLPGSREDCLFEPKKVYGERQGGA